MNKIFVSERAASRISVDRILHPQSVAVLGASDSLDKFGGRIMHFLTRHGFAGDIYPINMRRDQVGGRKAYPAIGAVPKAPDVAIMAVPSETLLDSLREVADAGVGCSVIISNGFAESGEAEGVERQQELIRISRRSGMRVIGPNCMGLIVPHHHMALCSSVVLNTDTLGDGSIGLISQSGALMVSIFDRAKTDGIGLRHGVSVGNQSDLEICDFLEYMVEDDKTKAICLYIEGLIDGVRFKNAAAACRKAGKPLFVVKTGRTEAGVIAAQSHTASLAGSHEAFSAVCREEGVIEAKAPEDMMRAAHYLTMHRGGTGKGVAVVSSSGGSAGIASDRLSEEGLEIARPTPETIAKLEEVLLPAQARNPIDLGGRIVPDTVEITETTTQTLMADPNVDYGIAVLTSMPDYANKSRMIAKTGSESGKPFVVAFAAGAAAEKPREEVRKEGVVFLDSFEDGVRVLSLMTKHDKAKALFTEPASRPRDLPAASAALAGIGTGYQTESEVKQLLASYGVKVAREAVVGSQDAVAVAAAGFDFPVVLKVVSPDIVHKSDVGGVRVGLGSADEVAAAAGAMVKRISKELPDAKIEGYSVQEMVKGEVEVFIGVRRDPQFGPIVLLGMGGVAVEILKDVAVATAPVSRGRALQMVDELRMSPLLKGARGRPLVDIDAIVDAVERISWLAHDLDTRLVDLEINPLIVRTQGGGAVAVDGRATLAAG
ncbi:acetate--CoA ligase family protein [Mesorhizobium sp. ZC-5]|uniref:acetate--CoA ligase family protein n=1 Tax=Mesorhizobium sp. ZC-5 TaxID=2986066 RepID=UPI0021E73DAF|nr:acetate--CoA ligase family protein [Mesorhizobium sp. ZC-5]MCV3240732.1 acetate--CoA ligase family protein [Mesorhizobium sp. ZC-5]